MTKDGFVADPKSGARIGITFEHGKVHARELWSVKNAPAPGTNNFILIDMLNATQEIHARFRVSVSSATFARVRLDRLGNPATAVTGGTIVNPVNFDDRVNLAGTKPTGGTIFRVQWATLTDPGTPFFIAQWSAGNSSGSRGDQIDPEWILAPGQKYITTLAASTGSPYTEVEVSFYES